MTLNLIDSCVMECYFQEHKAERGLLFRETMAPHRADYDPSASEAKQRGFFTHIHPIRILEKCLA